MNVEKWVADQIEAAVEALMAHGIHAREAAVRVHHKDGMLHLKVSAPDGTALHEASHPCGALDTDPAPLVRMALTLVYEVAAALKPLREMLAEVNAQFSAPATH